MLFKEIKKTIGIHWEMCPPIVLLNSFANTVYNWMGRKTSDYYYVTDGRLIIATPQKQQQQQQTKDINEETKNHQKQTWKTTYKF